MKRPHSFLFSDIAKECPIITQPYRLDDNRGERRLGLRIIVPEALQSTYPYNASAYQFLQQLRSEILHYGLIEFPDLPVNYSNHTLAQKAPWQHSYSRNPYLTDFCQCPHQDTPPYPTAFWLDKPRRFFSTWVISSDFAEYFYAVRQANPDHTIEQLHRLLVQKSLDCHQGLLLNRKPGLLLIDNSHHQRLFHARTCNFQQILHKKPDDTDTAMYAFNEIGLLHHIDNLDSRRGEAWRDKEEEQQVRLFIKTEKPF
ncbi:MAG: hypothetical protein KDI30_05300 [Pseudomonadales bacterium]|nr:hypothetical protein [Pseudomonadales bacterium]